MDDRPDELQKSSHSSLLFFLEARGETKTTFESDRIESIYSVHCSCHLLCIEVSRETVSPMETDLITIAQYSNIILVAIKRRKLVRELARDDQYQRQQLEQSVYCEAESRRTAAEDERQDAQGANQEKIKSTTQDLFELLERVQSSRLDDQRCVLPPYFSQPVKASAKVFEMRVAIGKARCICDPQDVRGRSRLPVVQVHAPEVSVEPPRPAVMRFDQISDFRYVAAGLNLRSCKGSNLKRDSAEPKSQHADPRSNYANKPTK
ncbi:hypothetical protein WN51_04415 [Melipona quadrifasciata]|uniref:Uncharacterized protein n=1 Tax=Melipona quadrifasciata TaxID=166423 RepID=A0A0M8ZUK1_9HYME|nr:hypothetical protein WN51_04415 [Melipona quadrifasciata]